MMPVDVASCPACGSNAEMHFREESDSDGPGNTVYAYMQCSVCGIRSREGIAFKDFKAQLRTEWAANNKT